MTECDPLCVLLPGLPLPVPGHVWPYVWPCLCAGFVLEGTAPWELPEALLGTLRLNHLDVKTAKMVGWCFVMCAEMLGYA